jgi:hypothetical protein
VRRIFAERFPFVAAFARSSRRLQDVHAQIGLAVGGEGGARLAKSLAMPTSPDTILRRIRRMPFAGASEPMRTVPGGDPGQVDSALTAQRIYQDLVTEDGIVGRYHSVGRFVRRLQAKQELPFRRLECGPSRPRGSTEHKKLYVAAIAHSRAPLSSRYVWVAPRNLYPVVNGLEISKVRRGFGTGARARRETRIRAGHRFDATSCSL